MSTERKSKSSGLLKRLLGDQSGNINFLTVAMTVPLLGMVGGGVDMSRYYLVKSRLQLACDAGALAGRKAMENGSWSTASNQTAQDFFDTNFADDAYGSSDRKRSFTEQNGVVSGQATATVDATLLKIFDIEEFPVKVDCEARMDLSNLDVMFVLDTTGSMDYADASGSGTRISALRSAVVNFVTTVQKDAGSSRIRYGFVPYSGNANVGHLLNREWLRDDLELPSREPLSTGRYRTTTEIDGYYQVSGQINQGGRSRVWSCYETTINFSYDAPIVSEVSNPDGSTTITTIERRRKDGTERECQRTGWRYWETEKNYNNYVEEKITTTTQWPIYTWRYTDVTFDITGLTGNDSSGLAVTGGSITRAIGNLQNDRPTDKTASWKGCILEAKTNPGVSATNTPTPAYDIQIDHIPDSREQTKWTPLVGGLAYGRSKYVTRSGKYSYYQSGYWSNGPVNTSDDYYNPGDVDFDTCPSPARALSTMTTSEVQTYVDGLETGGSTYHDIGMIWGGRLISPDGIYGSSNQVAPNGAPIVRHLIFMTDGETSPSDVTLGAYGLEGIKSPRVNSFSNLKDNIEERTLNVCSQVKNKNIRVWVIAFGLPLDDMLTNCASPNSAFTASNSTELNARFQRIASEIAQLRLTK